MLHQVPGVAETVRLEDAFGGQTLQYIRAHEVYDQRPSHSDVLIPASKRINAHQDRTTVTFACRDLGGTIRYTDPLDAHCHSVTRQA
jgi:hypothetical protein